MEYSTDLFDAHVKALREQYSLNDKITLIQVPQFLLSAFSRDVALSRGYYAFPPTGLQFIKQSLAEMPFQIDIIDLNYLLLKRVFDDPDFDMANWRVVLEEQLDTCDSKIIGVTCTCVPTDASDPDFFLTNVLSYLRDRDEFVLIAGGANASNDRRYLLEHNLCDFVVISEGEDKARYLFGALHTEKISAPPSSGIFYLSNGAVAEADGATGQVTTRENITGTYEDIPLEDYCQIGSLNPFSRMAGPDTPFATVQLNRGCRASCQFCGVSGHMGRGVRQRPIEGLIEEVQYLVEKRNIRHFDILDDDPIGTRRLRDGLSDFLNVMADLHQKYGVTWSASNGVIAASLDKEVLDLMQHSGCMGFRMGVESGNDAMIRRIRRPSGIKHLRQASSILQDYPDMFVCGNYIVGFFEEETFGEMMDTYRFSGEMSIDWAGFVVFQFIDDDGVLRESEKKGRNDFVPSHQSSKRHLATSDAVISGPDIFNLPRDLVPSPEQVNEIWFAFNLIGNYINNKNLMPGGRPEKYVSWIDAVRISYPANPYMPLFSGIGRSLMDDVDGAKECLEQAKANLKDDYWRNRMQQFGLLDLFENFPEGPNDTRDALARIHALYPDGAMENLDAQVA